jgi:hypothetical protein
MSARIGGRPSSYKASIASAICTQLREWEYLKSICQQEGMPSLNTVYRWRQEIQRTGCIVGDVPTYGPSESPGPRTPGGAGTPLAVP